MFNFLKIDILTLLLIAFVVLFVILILSDLYLNNKNKYLYYYLSKEYKNLCGYIVNINGFIGSGKTTLMYGLANMLSSNLINDINNKILETKTILYRLNFYDIDKKIEDFYKQELTSDEAFQILYQDYILFLTGSYNNYLTLVQTKSIFEDYIYIKYRLLNNHFWLSNTKVFNRITNNYGIYYDDTMISLKDNYLNNDFSIPNFCVIMEDEKLNNSKISTNWQKVASLDTGTSTFFRLQRNASKGSIYYLSTAQEAGRVVKEERQIFTSFIYVKSLKVVGQFYFISKYIQFLRKINQAILKLRVFFINNKKARIKYHNISILDRLKYKFYGLDVPAVNIEIINEFIDKKSIYLGNENIFKKIDFIYLKILSWLFSKSYLAYDVEIYLKAEDVGKNNNEFNTYSKSCKFVLPTKYCFGTGDTNYWSFVFDNLRKNSKIRFEDLDEYVNIKQDNEVIDKLLKKFKSEGEAKEDEQGF